MSSKLIFHAGSSPKAQELAQALKEKFSEVYVTKEGFPSTFPISKDLIAEDQENLIIAFPDEVNTGNIQEIVKEVLTETFQQAQSFIQARIKKKLGRILCLVNAGANGLSYNEGNNNAAFLSAQGGLVGMAKTLTKEYSKRGIIINTLYIDWKTIDFAELANTSLTLLVGNTHIRGQVFAIDGGKWL